MVLVPGDSQKVCGWHLRNAAEGHSEFHKVVSLSTGLFARVHSKQPERKKCSQHLHRSTSFPGNDSAKRQSSHFFCELLILRQDENEENPPAVRSSIWVVTRIPYSRVILWLIMILLVLYIIDSGSIVTINDYNLPIWIFPWITMISGIFCHRLRIWQSNINQGSVKELQCLEKQKICSCL